MNPYTRSEEQQDTSKHEKESQFRFTVSLEIGVTMHWLRLAVQEAEEDDVADEDNQVTRSQAKRVRREISFMLCLETLLS